MMIRLLAACADEGGQDAGNGDGAAGGEEEAESAVLVLNSVEVQTEGPAYEVTGEARAADNVFYYVVEHEENVIEEETEIHLEETVGWGTFEISGELPDSVTESEEPPTLTLYGKNEEGEEINSNFIPIDLSE